MMNLVNSASLNITNIDDIIGLTPAAKALTLTWTTIVIIIGVGGNGLVLLGSVKYQALRMDRVSIFLLECVAVTDMTITLFDFTSTFVTIIANEWVLGEKYCFFITLFEYVAYAVEIKLITAIAIFRCVLIARPFTVITDLTQGRKLLFVASVVGYETCFISSFFVFGYKVFFNPYMFVCDIQLSGKIGSLIITMCNVIGPGLVLISSNFYLLFKASMMSRDKLKKNSAKGLTTIMVLCWAFILSYGPFCVMIGLGFTEGGPPGWVVNLMNMSLGLNLFVNPLIYTFTNNRFFIFMKSMLGLSELSTAFLNRRKPA